MKVYVTKDEWYPSYDLSLDPLYSDGTIELTEDEFEEFRRMMTTFNEWHAKIHNEYVRRDKGYV